MEVDEVQTCSNGLDDSGRHKRGLTTTHPSRHWTLPIKWAFVAQEDWTESRYKGLDTNKYFGLTKADIDITRKAIKHIEDRTCVRFKEVKPNRGDYWMLVFRVAQAPIGANEEFQCLFNGATPNAAFNQPKTRRPGLRHIYKRVNKEKRKCYNTATGLTGAWKPSYLEIQAVYPDLSLMIHELLHIIGLEHTQQRLDASDHIEIIEENINDYFLKYYQPCNVSDQCPHDYNTYNIPYDCSSIMHYRNKNWAKAPNLDTMKAKHPDKCDLNTPIREMSKYDIQFVQAMYNCTKGIPNSSWVSCGDSLAPSCEECPQGNGKAWCNQDCHWRHGQCRIKGDGGDSDEITWTGQRGNWAHQPTFCPYGSFVNGYEVRVDSKKKWRRGDARDATALNDIILYCSEPGSVAVDEIWSDHTRLGYWRREAWCSSTNTSVVGFKVREEGPQGRGDDTALNSIAMYCSDGQEIRSHPGYLGEWKPKQMCPQGKAVNGIQTQVQRFQRGRDNTALNGVRLFCSDYP